MRKITTFEELNNLRIVNADEEIQIDEGLCLTHDINVYGTLIAYNSNNTIIHAYDNSTIHAHDNSTIHAYDNSTIHAHDNSTIHAHDNSTIHAHENSTVLAHDNSTIHAHDNSTVLAYDKSTVYAYDKSTVYAYDTVLIRGYSWQKLNLLDNSILQTTSDLPVALHGNASLLKIKYLDFLERYGIEKADSYILYKRVSVDFKTREGTENETLWLPGTTVICRNWDPTISECGLGKLHAVIKPYFADIFRSKKDDRYIAIRIKAEDLYEWKHPAYPYKIAFREGYVLYECDREGNKIDVNPEGR